MTLPKRDKHTKAIGAACLWNSVIVGAAGIFADVHTQSWVRDDGWGGYVGAVVFVGCLVTFVTSSLLDDKKPS